MSVEPSATVNVTLHVNGKQHTAEVEARLLLVHFLRENLDLTGTHIGCDTSNCGACTVLLDGQAIKSCTLLTVHLHPLQEGFFQEHGLQCGFCTPGMLLSAKALLAASPNPTEEEVRRGISGNLCRCTGYVNIVKAIQYGAAALRGETPVSTQEPSTKEMSQSHA